MSVYKPKGSPYFHYDFQWQGARFYGSTGRKTRRGAEQVEDRKRQEATNPQQGDPPITLDDACGLYARHADKQPSWPTTRYMIQALLKLGARRLLSEISQRELNDFIAKRRDGRSNAAVNRELDNVRAIWRYAAGAGYDVGKMPAWKALRLKVVEAAPRELSNDEEDRLFAEMRADVADACDFALKSGWRRGEVIGLRWSDCDFQARQAKTRIKGGDTIKRPLTPTLVALIANQPRVGPFVFTYVCKKSRVKRRKGERYPLTATVLRSAMKAAKTEAKVEDFRFHDFRHTRGTRILRATGNLATAQKALAHKSIKTTLRYAHVLDDDVRNALDASESRTIPEASDTEAKKA